MHEYILENFPADSTRIEETVLKADLALAVPMCPGVPARVAVAAKKLVGG